MYKMEKKLSDLSNDELRENLKTAKNLLVAFIVLLLLMVIIGVISFIKDKGINPVFISALAMMIFIFIYYKKSKELKAEIKSREKASSE